MNFEDWMLYKGLSSSTAKKYEGAIRGVLSEWAINHGLISGPLTSPSDRANLEAIAAQIHNLEIFQERNNRGHGMYSNALSKFAEYLSENHESNIESDIEEIINDPTITETEKSALVKSRIGQGSFRQKLISHWNGCAVTGFKDLALLVASHIKPWRSSTNEERLDPFNGLLLTPSLDKAFDRGLISFTPEGKILISPKLTEAEKLGIHDDMYAKISEAHEKFMSFHRSVVFRAK